MDRAEARANRAESDASARGLEAQGNAEQIRRTEAYGDIRVRVEAATAESITQARSAQMRPILSRPIAPLAFAIMTAACATSPRPVVPPRLVLPDAAARPCALALLPDNPTIADLDATYMQRGAQVVSCDAARALAVETLIAERRLIDEWLRLELGRRQVGSGAPRAGEAAHNQVR